MSPRIARNGRISATSGSPEFKIQERIWRGVPHFLWSLVEQSGFAFWESSERVCPPQMIGSRIKSSIEGSSDSPPCRAGDAGPGPYNCGASQKDALQDFAVNGTQQPSGIIRGGGSNSNSKGNGGTCAP